jgi:sec-independent protein translocase protein TatB
MFDIGASELLLTVIVAIVVIGPKDLPRALRMAGSWIAKIRRVSGHFRSGIEEMIRQAELDEMEKKWREKNAAIMQQEAQAGPGPEAGPEYATEFASSQEPVWTDPTLVPPQSSDAYGHMAPTADNATPATPHFAPPVHDVAASEVVSPELPLSRPKAQP